MKFQDLNLKDVGLTIGLVGAVFDEPGRTYLCLFPGQKIQDQLETLEMDLEDWKTFLRQVDLQEVEVLQRGADGKLSKTILRKSQRLIEQRVSWSVFRRDGYQCRYCGAEGVPLTVDHLILWEEGGPSIESNLVAACRKCNKTRGNMQYEAWLESPYYKKVSAGLPPGGHEKNVEVLMNLAVPLRHTERRTRK